MLSNDWADLEGVRIGRLINNNKNCNKIKCNTNDLEELNKNKKEVIIEDEKECQFIFSLSQEVLIDISTERGKVLARTQYLNGENQYLVHYEAKDRCARTEWFQESLLREKPLGLADYMHKASRY